MPVAPGRNIAILVEVAARNQLLKERGYDAARRFAERVDELIEAGGDGEAAGRGASGPVAGTRRGGDAWGGSSRQPVSRRGARTGTRRAR